MTRESVRPPRVATALLRLRRLGDRAADIEGDLRQLFHTRTAESGARVARRRYWSDVLSLWRRRAPGRHVPAGPSTGRSFKRAMGNTATDVAYAVRLYRRQPAILVAAVLGLGTTLGVSTCVFSFVNAIVFRPSGVADPPSVVRVIELVKNGAFTGFAIDDYRRMRAGSRDVALEAANEGRSAIEMTRSGARDASAFTSVSFVSETYFQTMGAPMARGRALASADDAAGAAPAAVISYPYWQTRFGGDPAIVGTTLVFNGAPFVVVGVTARSYSGLTGSPPPFWLPLGKYRDVFRGGSDAQSVQVWGRLAAGVSVAQAQTSLSALVVSVSDRNAASPITGVRLDPGGARFSARDRPMVLLAVTIVLTAIGFLVMLASVNLTNLLLANATMRRREFGVRLALGASRGRLVRQLITESLLLASLSAASGWLFTVWGLPILAVATNVPETADVSPDVRVYAFLVGIAALAGVGVGLVPAFQGTSGSLASSVNSDDLRAGVSPRPRRIRKVLTAVQAALCVVLLVSAALLVKSVIRVTSVELGFDAQRLVVVSPDLPSHGYDAARAAVFFDSAVDRLRAVPGVSGVSVVLNPPLGGRNWTGLTVRDGQTIRVNINRATPDYFATAGMPLVLGRTLGPGDDASHGVVVSENLARLVQGDGSPIGAPLSRVTHLFPSEVIVGVVADTRSANARDGAAWYVYHPMTSKDRVESSIVIRAAGDPRPVVPAIAAAIRAVDPNLRVEAQLVSASFRHELEDMRAFATVASVIGGLAFLLAVTGIYGITAFLVSERTREIGLRLAIGATTAQVMRRLIRDGLRPVVIGLACGAVAAFGAGQALAGALATSPTDPASFSIGIGALAAAALAAIVVPARRVLRIDPATVLRSGG